MMAKMLFTADELSLLFDAVDESMDKARMLGQQQRYTQLDELLSRIEYAFGRVENDEIQHVEDTEN